MGLRERLNNRSGRPNTFGGRKRRVVTQDVEAIRPDLEVTEVYDADELHEHIYSAPGDRHSVNVRVAPPVVAPPAYRETIVYDNYWLRKTIQAIWLIVGFFEVLLALRFLLRVLGANPENPFAFFIYSITAPLVWPFATLVGAPQSGASVFEWSTIIAMLVYWLIGWLVTKLIVFFWDRPPEHEHVTVDPVVPTTTYVDPAYPPVPHDHAPVDRVTHIRRTL